ncbi:CLUMA_CG017717, isoform A [Clunio marinus]|uniref:CLUMA_CG017717, isoform A n=1 Tax=Clunio marinus TaxID=568069 RepID=A0A1J1IWR2_9DIPT|nr:CLUMA_CG017717, isoform A [Clunio marinus]
MSSVGSKKNKKRNAFWTFAQRFMRENNITDIETGTQEAGLIWQNLSETERQDYRNKLKRQERGSIPNLNSFQEVINDKESQKSHEKQKHEAMLLVIDEILTKTEESGLLKNYTFYFFNSSYFVQTSSGEVFLAEIAMSKYNLIEGIYDSFNTIINPGPLSVGMAGEAIIHAASTHKIAMPSPDQNISNYKEILDQILKFLEVDEGKTIPLIFALSGSENILLQQGMSALKTITEKADSKLKFRLIPVEYLLFKLYQKCKETANIDNPLELPLISAKAVIINDFYQFYDLGCEYHKSIDLSLECCLSKVFRMGFTISKYCLNDNDSKRRGCHFPHTMLTEILDDPQSLNSDEWSEIEISFQSLQKHSNNFIPSNTLPKLVHAPCSFIDSAGKKLSSIQDQEIVEEVQQSEIESPKLSENKENDDSQVENSNASRSVRNFFTGGTRGRGRFVM